MEANEHLAGCDGRHGKRQRCNGHVEPVAPPAEQLQTDSVAISPPFDRDLLKVAGLLAGCLFAIVAFPFVLLLGVVLLYASAGGFNTDDDSRPALPAFAHPPNTWLSDQRDLFCGDTDQYSQCSEMLFVAPRSADGYRARLLAQLQAENWER